MYLLDTNILSEIIRKKPNPILLARLRSKASHKLFTSSICVMEMRYGSRLRDDFEDFWHTLGKEIISRIHVLPIGQKEAEKAGDILAKMKKTGQMIGLEDILIASTAMTHQCIVVTANVRHFTRIKGLSVVNWLEAV